MRIGILVTTAALMDSTWTTLHLAQAAMMRGHSVQIIDRADLEIGPDGEPAARAFVLGKECSADSASIMTDLASRRLARRRIALREFDLILMRSAPMTPDLVAFAMFARDVGVRVVNDPAGTVMVAHKGWLAAQPNVPTPATLVTRSTGTAALFYTSCSDGVIIKPCRGSGGNRVHRIPPGTPSSFQRIFSSLNKDHSHLVVQAYLPEAEHGEKRLLWLNGQLIGGYLRQRAAGEFRHNVKQGGIASPTTITTQDRAITAPLTPLLLAAGIQFAGLDVIGSHIIEVNVLNPGGTWRVRNLTGVDLADDIIAQLELQPTTHRIERSTWASLEP